MGHGDHSEQGYNKEHSGLLEAEVPGNNTIVVETKAPGKSTSVTYTITSSLKGIRSAQHEGKGICE
jgi:hypothetical protein